MLSKVNMLNQLISSDCTYTKLLRIYFIIMNLVIIKCQEYYDEESGYYSYHPAYSHDLPAPDHYTGPIPFGLPMGGFSMNGKGPAYGLQAYIMRGFISIPFHHSINSIPVNSIPFHHSTNSIPFHHSTNSIPQHEEISIQHFTIPVDDLQLMIEEDDLDLKTLWKIIKFWKKAVLL